MKEAVGGFSLFNIVIVFVLLFTGYITLSINHSKAYNVKNEVVNIIKNNGGVCSKKDGGVCENFQEQITDFFQEANYRSSGNCDAGWTGFKRNGERVDDGNKAAFCVKGISLNTHGELPNAVYYKVKIFYQIDLPIIGNFFDFSVNGETSRVYSPNECKAIGDSTSYGWCQI